MATIANNSPLCLFSQVQIVACEYETASCPCGWKAAELNRECCQCE